MSARNMKGAGATNLLIPSVKALLGYFVGASMAALVWMLFASAMMLVAPAAVHAANGQCKWEGGPGAPTYASCDVEDCTGDGGHAQCSEPIITPTEHYVDGDNFAYQMCEDTAAYTYNWDRWCVIEGGTFSGDTGCTNIPPPNNADLSVSSEATAVADANEFEGAPPCGGSLASDSGWGYVNPQDPFCGASTTMQNGKILSEMRQLTYSQANSCGVIPPVVVIQRLRAMGCNPGYYQRTLPNGYLQCIKPATACCLVGNPVNPVTGAKVQEFTDYKAGGIGGLEFRRYYNSSGGYRYPGSGPFIPSFSDYWEFSYQRHLTPVSGSTGVSATLQEEDGTIEQFDASGNEILNRSGAADKLQSNGSSGWTLLRADGATEVYDANGNLDSVTELNGLAISITYSSGAISTIADSFGHSISLGYNPSGQLTTVTLPDGSSTISYGYGAAQQLISVTYPDHTTVEYQYNDPQNSWLLTGIEDESAQQYARYSYYGNGSVASEYHGNNVESYTFSQVVGVPPGSPVSASVTDPLSESRVFSYTDTAGVYRQSGSQVYCSDCGNVGNEVYDSNGNPQSITDLDGHGTVYAFDETRNLETSRTEGLSGGQATAATRTIATQWHSTLRLPVEISVYAGATATGAPLNSTSYAYDSYGNVLTKSVTDGTSGMTRTWSYTYFNGGRYGQVESVDGPRTDVADVTGYTYYDCTSGGECGQLHTVTDALGHTVTYNSYDANGMPLQITDQNGTITTLTYDKRQRLTSRTVGGEETQFAYYPTGLLQRVTMPDGSSLSYIYDTAHRLTEVDDSLDDRLVYTLDAAGNRQATQVYDPSGTLVRTGGGIYNSLGQLWQQLTSAATTSTTTVYGYDAQGNVTSTAAPLGRTIGATYDALNRLETVTDPAGVTGFSYDADDDITGVTDSRGLNTSYNYNGFGDVTGIQSPDSGASQFTYDSGGNLATEIDGRSAKTVYSYDALNRITKITYPDQNISYAYDQGARGIGHVSSISDGTGQTGFSYDALGRISQKTETIGNLSLSVSYGYQNGDLSSLTTPSGQALVYGYNANGQISSITLNGSILLGAVQYSPFGAVSGWAWSNGTQTARDYDLDGYTTEIDSAGSSTYTYNDDGTIGSRSDDSEADYSVVPGTTNVSVSSTSNQVASTSGTLVRTYSYDGAGNTLGNGSAGFSYNGANRLSSITGGGTTVTFGVNALGQRVSKASPSGTVLFVYDEQGHLIGEYGSTGSLIEETVWLGDIPVATLRPDPNGGVDVYYVHTDQLNTPRRVTRPADNVVIWRWSSDPYGNGFVDEDPEGGGQLFVYNLRFPGQYYDSETGLVYNYRRDYDPQLGRYVESDPLGLGGGLLDTYAYTAGDPIDYFDQDGTGGMEVDEGNERDELPFEQPLLPISRQQNFTPVYSFNDDSETTCGRCLTVYYIANVEGGSRSTHRNQANRQLYEFLTGPNGPLNYRYIARDMEGPNGLRNPRGFEWHHPLGSPDTLWLVTTCQHRGDIWQELLHPEGFGGFHQYYAGPPSK